MNPVTPWMHDRPVRNMNPGDLRPRSGQPEWPGQDAVDNGPGGPFAIFVTDADGWAALGLWCLDARYLRGMRTARAMIEIFAPPSENDTESYIAGVELRMGKGELDLSNNALLEQLCKAIAHWEDYRAAWDEAAIVAGIRLCSARWPGYRATRLEQRGTSQPSSPVHPPAENPAATETADQLNQDEINKLA